MIVFDLKVVILFDFKRMCGAMPGVFEGPMGHESNLDVAVLHSVNYSFQGVVSLGQRVTLAT